MHFPLSLIICMAESSYSWTGFAPSKRPLVVNAELLAELLGSQVPLRMQERHFLSCVERMSSRVVLRLFAHALRVCEYLHALVYGVDAGGHERAGALTSTMQIRHAPISFIFLR